MNLQSSANSSMARRARMLDFIRQQGFVSIPELKDSLDVSESTIRRDLESLEESGEARRTHGGVFYTGSVSSIRQFQRPNPNDGAWDKKRAIALQAAKLVSDHDTVLLDGGSTTYELAKQLVGRPLQIVTNSLPVANLFSASDSVDLVVLGGAIHNRTGVTHGPYTDQMLETINVQKAFLSVAGVNEKGFYNSNMLLVETERCMMRASDRTIIVADSTKFGRSSLARMCEWGQVDTLVVDQDLSSAWRDRIESMNTKLILASLEEHSEEPQTLTS